MGAGPTGDADADAETDGTGDVLSPSELPNVSTGTELHDAVSASVVSQPQPRRMPEEFCTKIMLPRHPRRGVRNSRRDHFETPEIRAHALLDRGAKLGSSVSGVGTFGTPRIISTFASNADGAWRAEVFHPGRSKIQDHASKHPTFDDPAQRARGRSGIPSGRTSFALRCGMTLTWRLLALALALATCSAAVACTSEPVTDAPEIRGPGTKALDSDDPTCHTTSDCADGEQCVDGICQIQRCSSHYRSNPPLGKRSYFSADRELVVLDDAPSKHTLDGYEPTNGSFAHPTNMTVDFGNDRIVDETGGNFTGSRPEGVAAALAGKTAIVVVVGQTKTEIPIGFTPVAIASGDVEGDGVDEIVALSNDGNIAICSVPTKTCVRTNVASANAKDIAMADVDADGHDEPIVLADKNGTSFITVLHDSTGKGAKAFELDTGHTAQRIAAGDVDHDGAAEILTLENGGYGDFVADTLRVFNARDGKLVELGSTDIAKDAIDIYAGDTDGDDKAEVLVLENSGIEVLDVASPSSMKSAFKTVLTASSQATRLAMADLDGDSPAGTLVGDAELVAGPVVPVSILVYPPYSRSMSDGTGQIGIGNRETKSEVEATTVSLKAGITVGYEGEFPGGLKFALLGKIDTQIARTNAQGRSIAIGDRFTVDARPDLEGPDNGVAVLACACYHAYTYTVDDPAGRLGSRAADKKKMSVFVPVGGQTALWSLKRYNVLAARLGSLPVVNVPYVVGDLNSYPTSMQTLAGKPIPDEDLVFTTPRSYRTSDVARTGWQLDVSENTTQTSAQTTGVSVRGQLRVGGIYAETDVGGSTGESYSVAIGRDAYFSGSVPPIRNDVRTPEDENALYSYGFTPIVYRDHYKTKTGTGGLFVVTYSVAR